jgi:hypothetical protein
MPEESATAPEGFAVSEKRRRPKWYRLLLEQLGNSTGGAR